MKAKIYEILRECIELGIKSGYNSGTKHLEDEDCLKKSAEDHIFQAIDHSIWNNICDKFTFDLTE